MTTESPNIVYRRLLEAAHLGGYAAERVASEFKWLLIEDRWKQAGAGFDDIDKFLSEINLSQYRIAVEDRKEIVKLLDGARATQRASAKALGISHTTVQNDLGNKLPGLEAKANGTESQANDSGNKLPAIEWFQAPPSEIALPTQKKIMREEKRESRQSALVSAIAARESLPQETSMVDVLLADPPWQYDFAETSNREIENQYPTATLEEICGHIQMKWFPLPAINSVLLLWATAPKLLEALDVMAAWGFEYRTHAMWDKEKIGMGYWFRGQHELLLIGTRGEISPPAPELRFSSVFREVRRDHSKKPECVYRAIEAMFPGFVLGEIYQREQREGWKGFRVET